MESATLIFVSNITVGVVTLLPVVVVLELCKRIKAGQAKYLFSGVILITWAVLVFSVLSESIANIAIAAEGDVITNDLKAGFQKIVSIWMYALPAVSLAIGANLITTYYTKS